MVNVLSNLLKIEYPIIQAPMAGGVSTPELAAAVSEAGGLGMLGAGYLNPDETREQIRKTKKLTAKPFGINLFVPEKVSLKETIIKDAYEALQPFREELGASSSYSLTHTQYFKEQLQVVLEEQVPVCSFTFGLPTLEEAAHLKENNVTLIGTATTVDEAILAEQRGMDAIVAQGSEAGGHRGTFLGPVEESLIGLVSLVPQAADHVTIPVVGAGGIMDARGINALLCLGASGAQMGTAFLTCKESGANEAHKEAVLQASEDQLVLTKVFSGKSARGIRNTFVEKMEKTEAVVAPYPIQNSLTGAIRKEAAKQKKAEYLSLWSGQSPRLSKKQTVKELMEQLTDGIIKDLL